MYNHFNKNFKKGFVAMSRFLGYFKYVLFILLFLCIINFNTFLCNLEPYDELWNFQNVLKIHNGNTIYTELNVIITPLFFEIGNFFLHIFGNTINSFRIYNVCIYSLLFLQIFLIFKQLKVKDDFAILYVSLIISCCYSIIAGGANYNTLAYLFICYGISHYIKHHNSKYFDFFEGIIIYLIFFTKQNLGVYYVLGTFVFEIWNNKSLKKTIILFLKRFFPFVILISITFIFMFIKGNLLDFFNMTFGGLFDFGNSNLATENLIFAINYVFIIFLFIYFLKKNLIPEEYLKNSKLLFCISIFTTLSIFPIVNTTHMMFSYLIFYILLFYILHFTFIGEIFCNKKHFIILNICSLLILICINLHIFVYHFPNFENWGSFDKNNHFYNVPMEPELKEKIETVSQYILKRNSEGVDVILITSDAAYTMINLNQNHNYFDLAFNGNLGYDGVNRLIEKISQSTKTEFLIYTNQEDMFWQESLEIRNYIINNLEKSGEILNYSIYYKN